MFNFLRNLPIFRRLFIAFTLSVVIPSVVIALLGSFYLNTLNMRGQAVKTSFNAQNTASLQQINLQRMNAQLETRFAQIYASRGAAVIDPSLKASGSLIANDIRAREIDFDQTLQTYVANYDLATSEDMKGIRDILLGDDLRNQAIINEQQDALQQVIAQKEWQQYKNAQDKVLDLLDNNTTSYKDAYDALFDARYKFLPLRNSWQRVVDIAVTIGTTVTQVGPSQTQPVLMYTLVALFFTIMVIIATGFMVNFTITNPLRQLALLTRRISRGDTTARVQVKGHDEISVVAASMNAMLDNILRLIQEAQSLHADLRTQVEKLVGEVSGVGEGDLRIQAEVTMGDLGVLSDSFNYMVEELSSLIVRVKTLIYEVKHATVLTSDRMAQLVESANRQIQQISTAQIEVEHMTDSTSQVAERAQVLYQVAYEARLTANTGRSAVHQTVEGMERIHDNVQSTAGKVQLLGERSQEINNIVSVISSIAHQTNRLALDAAIHAAMAGDNGKGFGAIAVDIRRLAERAKEQTNMISRIVRSVLEDISAVAVSINDTEHETSEGSKLVQEAGTALESIFSAVERQASEIEIINQMAVGQLESSRAVAQIMQLVSDATQQSSISTSETSRQMQRMEQLAEQLLSSVEAFKLRESQNSFASGAKEQQKQFAFSGSLRSIPSPYIPQAMGETEDTDRSLSNQVTSLHFTR